MVSAAAASLFAGEGVARATARAVNWAETPLGPPESWSPSLQATVRMLLSSRHPMFLFWGPELIQLYNDAYLPSIGVGKHPAAMGQRGVDCWEEIWPIIYPQIEDVMLRAQASWNENQLVPIYRNGRIEEVYWSYGYSPVFDDAGQVGGTLVVCTETTAGVLAVRRLEFVRRLSAALNAAQDSIQVASIIAKCLASNPRDIPFAVVSLEGVPSLPVGLELATALSIRARLDTEIFPLAEPLHCSAWPEPVTEAKVYALDGAPGGHVVFGLSPRLPLDASYEDFLRQILEQVASSQARIAVGFERRRLLLQAPVAAALLTGPDHLFEMANPRYVQMVGREVLGKRYTEAFPEIIDTPLPGILGRVYQLGEPFVTDRMRVLLAPEPGGELEEHYFNFNLEPIRDVRGEVYGMMVIAVDITAQVRAHEALAQTNVERAQLLAAAQVASRAKDEFLAMLGHELRNPLAPILTALDLMKVKNAAGTEREREIIQRQAKHLVGLVDDLLDVSRVVAGKIELKKRRLSLAKVVATAVETATPLLEKRRHQLRIDVPSDGLEVDADPMRLAQVVANLLTNAARYTEPGGLVTLTAHGDAEEVVLSVQDTGIGIPPEQLPFLFDRFFQAPRSEHRAQGGLGLGLALVKSLVELHGGAVSAASAGVGKGSTFEVRLARAAGELPSSPTNAQPRPTPTSLSDERVLLVDDSQDITEVFGAFLELEGLEVRTAQDGPSALRLAASYQPTVVVLDLGLPVMDGYEIAAKLREQLGAAAPRLIAMSGYGQKDDIARTREAGFERHLIKPVDAEALLRAILG